jgi:hypothetical protein
VRIIFAVFGLALVITGAVLLLVPREDVSRAQTRSVAPQVVSLAVQARDLAEKVNAPLSILFGIVSLYYSRRRYIVERENHGNGKPT